MKLLGGFEPLIGDTFDIVLGTSVAGAFATEILPVFDGRTFDVVLGLDFVRLTVTAAPIPIPAAGACLVTRAPEAAKLTCPDTTQTLVHGLYRPDIEM